MTVDKTPAVRTRDRPAVRRPGTDFDTPQTAPADHPDRGLHSPLPLAPTIQPVRPVRTRRLTSVFHRRLIPRPKPTTSVARANSLYEEPVDRPRRTNAAEPQKTPQNRSLAQYFVCLFVATHAIPSRVAINPGTDITSEPEREVDTP